MRKSNERILLETLMTPAAIAREGLILTSFEGLDDCCNGANTAKKREALAHSLTATLNTFLGIRQNLGASLKEELAKNPPDYKRMHAQIHTNLDAAVCVGFLIGKYAPNNEYLDNAVSQVRMQLQKRKTMLGAEGVDEIQSIARKAVDKSLAKMREENPNITDEVYAEIENHLKGSL